MFKKPQDKFHEELDKQVPEWRRINNDPEFAEWLNQRDEQTGRLKQDLFLKAYDMLDVSTAVSFFKEYIREKIMNEPEKEKPPAFSYKEGDFIGGYFEVSKVLGKGGCGVVYLVYLDQRKEVFALKTFRDEYLKDSEIKQRFLKEAEIWVGLDKHPFLVRADFVLWLSDDPRPFIAIEYIAPNEDGLNTLEGYLRHYPPDLPQSLRWAIQFCHGMEHAYSKGIRAHRDIKPANIMISHDRIVKISDFGLAGVIIPLAGEHRIGLNIQENRIGLSFQTMEGQSFGTPTHMPPEQFTNAASCDERSDIYSFGIVLYQMASGGSLPFLASLSEERSEKEMLNFWRKMHELHSVSPIPKLNNPLFPIIQHCVNKQPAQRYQSFKDLRKDLEKVLKKMTGEVIAPPKSQELDAREWDNKGVCLVFFRHYDEAIGCFNKALEMDSRDVRSWRNKANVLHSFLKRYEEAIACYNKILEIEPNNGTIWRFKGNSLCELSRFDEAIKCYSKALEINSIDVDACTGIGTILFNQGRYEEAEVWFSKALKIDPRSVVVWHNKGHCFYNSGRFFEAVECYNKILEIEPENSLVWFCKGTCLNRLGHFYNAIECLDKALEIEPQNVDAWVTKVDTLARLGHYSEIIESCNKALEFNSKHPMLWYRKAFVEDKLCQNKDAIISYQQFITLAPTQYKKEINYAQQRLNELEGK